MNRASISGIFNCGTGQAVSYNNITNIVIKYFKKGKLVYIKFPSILKGSYQSYTKSNTKKLRDVGCAVDFTKITPGIKKYLHFLEYKNIL